jgi:hypothetical protein
MVDLTKSQRSQVFTFEAAHIRTLRTLRVVGDLHGDYAALQSLLKLADLSQEAIVFLGDYADRGDRGVEVIEAVTSLMARYPNHVIALKGNHEAYTDLGYSTFSPCDLIEEVKRKRGDWHTYFLRTFQPFLHRLYLAAIIPNELLFVHGGVSSHLVRLEDLHNPTIDLEKDILWSDPFDGEGEHPNPRGVGVEFGSDISQHACLALGVKRIIRSHEPTKALNGPYYAHQDRIITVNSTSRYGGHPFILNIDPTNYSTIAPHFL